MRKHRHLLSNVWEEFSMELADEGSVLKPISVGKYIADILTIGPYYYFVLNVIDNTVHLISEEILKIHGLKDYPVYLNEIIELIHPDDVDFVFRAEKASLEKVSEIGFQHKSNLKSSYCFRMKVADGSYRLFHHQVIYVSVDDRGRFWGVLNIHTDIQHVTSENNHIVLISGTGSRKDYHQIDLSVKQVENIVINLTKREMDVLLLIAKGLSSERIAGELFISMHTVRIHRKNLLKKTGSGNSSELIKKCIEVGLL